MTTLGDEKLRVVGLSDSERISMIYSAVLIQYTRVSYSGLGRSRFSHAPLGNLGPSLQLGIDTVTASDHVRVSSA